jgi:SAM-dependent methyltransferase
MKANSRRAAYSIQAAAPDLFSYNGLDCLYPKESRLVAIAEIYRVLRPQGRFIFSTHKLAAFAFGAWNAHALHGKPWPYYYSKE